MKVVHVTPVYAPAWQYGGPVRSTHLLACALAAKGHEITVLTTTIGTPQAPIFTAPNICDALPWFDDAAGRKAWRQSHAIATDECVIMHVGRIHPKKNLHFLVESAAALSSQRAWRVVLVGPVAERDEPYLSQLQATLPPQRLTVIRGTGDVDALGAAYSSADIFVLPSFAENFGNAVVEALLCNTPVVLSPHVGVGSLVEPLGGTTILPLSQHLWVAELEQRLKLSPGQRVDARARSQIAELFSAASITAQFEQLYASCTTAHHTAAIG